MSRRSNLHAAPLVTSDRLEVRLSAFAVTVSRVDDLNEFGQPVGVPLSAWQPPPKPSSRRLTGRLVGLESLTSETHAERMFAAFAGASPSLWTYMNIGPFESPEALALALDDITGRPDSWPYAVLVNGKPLGFASYLRIDQPNGVLEVGSIAFASALQRTTSATEALYLMIDHAFDLGYRRCEWKCDDLNARSRSAAERLGFLYEGTFRQATHYKGRNRDTAWYAITDLDWNALRPAFRRWLLPDNFSSDGQQRKSLHDMLESTPPRASGTTSRGTDRTE